VKTLFSLTGSFAPIFGPFGRVAARNPRGKVMPETTQQPNHLRPRREKVFGDGPGRKLDGNAKARIMTRARALMRRTEKGKHYGAITGKTLAVLQALLWKFHNARGGLCFPSYERIAKAADCSRSTVAEAIKALEETGILSWVNRITRIRDRELDLFGRWATRWRVIRTSNAYVFRDLGAGCDHAQASKSEIRSGLLNQELSVSSTSPALPALCPDTPLNQALIRFGTTLGAIA
jgi:AraC-like DNA-binding protein